MIDIKNLRITPSDINSFFFCPAKWYFSVIAQVPAMVIPKPEADFGTLVHNIIADYYQNVPDNPDEAVIFETISRVFKNNIVPVEGYTMEKVKELLRRVAQNFYRFELERLGKWKSYKPLLVEKLLEYKPFVGKVDAFWDKDGVVVDWKTGSYSIFNEALAVQGTIYKFILEGNGYKVNKILFVYLKNYKVLELQPATLNEIEAKIQNMIEQIRKGVFTKRNDRACARCEYQLSCRFDDLSIFDGLGYLDLEVVI